MGLTWEERAAKDDLFEILDRYQTHLGKGVEIAKHFLQELLMDRVDGHYYLPEKINGTDCGCIHHSALVVLELIDTAKDEYPGWFIADSVNNLIRNKFNVLQKFAECSTFETWLENYINLDGNYSIRNENRALVIEWVEGWLKEHSNE